MLFNITAWPDWVIFESSRLQIILQEEAKYLLTLFFLGGGYFESWHFLSKNDVVMFWG